MLLVVRLCSSYEQYQNVVANAYCSVVTYIDSSQSWESLQVGPEDSSQRFTFCRRIIYPARYCHTLQPPCTLAYRGSRHSPPIQHNVTCQHAAATQKQVSQRGTGTSSAPAVPRRVARLQDIRTAPSSLSSLLFEHCRGAHYPPILSPRSTFTASIRFWVTLGSDASVGQHEIE